MFFKPVLPLSFILMAIIATGCTKVIKVVEKPIVQKIKVETPQPKPVSKKPTPKPKAEERFVPVCLSTLSGCEEIRNLKKKIAKLNALLEMRENEFKDLIGTYFNELNPNELSPQAAVEYKYSKDPQSWKSLEEDISTNATVKVRYGSLKQRIGSQRARDLNNLHLQLIELDEKWKNFKKYSTVPFTINGLSKNVSESTVAVISIPKNLTSLIPNIQPTTKKLFVSLINNQHGLKYHIIDEQSIELDNYFTFDYDQLVLSFNSKPMIKTHSFKLDTPLEQVCEVLRVELRIQNNERLRRIRKNLVEGAVSTKSKQSLIKKKTSILSKKNKTDTLFDKIIASLTAPDTNQNAKFMNNQWSLPPLADDKKEKLLNKLFSSLKTKGKAKKTFCINHEGQELYKVKTDESDFKSILIQLGLSSSLLVPEESLRFKYTFKDELHNGFAEPEDLGLVLFDTIAKRKKAVLKTSARFKDIPYKVNLDTDTGRKIALPVFVDGLTSKRDLPKTAKWRIIGVGRKFDIMNEPLHSKFLSEVSRSGMVQLSDISYNRSYQDVLTEWKESAAYDIGLALESGDWLGSVKVLTYSRLWIHSNKSCDIALDIKTEERRVNNLLAPSSLVQKATFQKADTQYVQAYVDPPNCQ